MQRGEERPRNMCARPLDVDSGDCLRECVGGVCVEGGQGEQIETTVTA